MVPLSKSGLRFPERGFKSRPLRQRYLYRCVLFPGEVLEWSNRHAWRACVAARLPWVRIPPSPPVKVIIDKLLVFWFSVFNILNPSVLTYDFSILNSFFFLRCCQRRMSVNIVNENVSHTPHDITSKLTSQSVIHYRSGLTLVFGGRLLFFPTA
jgi:hypothetical protein